ncbi:hypothetical protein VNO78_02764 [Psophocarpus tetragonolobus]|uniref:Uncharacterized protein n=1 Tax=Psophocarpus tetragonolobus TaxID=3891 RepID=A0AAN9XVB4_PSOTE
MRPSCSHLNQAITIKKFMVMEASASICNNSIFSSSPAITAQKSATFSPLLVKFMATPKPLPSVSRTVVSRKNATVFPLGEQPRSSAVTATPPIKLLTRMEQLKLLSKAEKAGLLSAAEKFGFSLSAIERLGLLSKAEELGVLSAATDPATPGTLLILSLGLLILGPLFVYLVPEDNLGEVGLQVLVALVSVIGGSSGFAASNFVSNLQKLK